MMEENICELNNRSKEVRPEDYVTDKERIYITVPFNKGKCSFDYLYQLLYPSSETQGQLVGVLEFCFIDCLQRRSGLGR